MRMQRMVAAMSAALVFTLPAGGVAVGNDGEGV